MWIFCFRVLLRLVLRAGSEHGLWDDIHRRRRYIGCQVRYIVSTLPDPLLYFKRRCCSSVSWRLLHGSSCAHFKTTNRIPAHFGGTPVPIADGIEGKKRPEMSRPWVLRGASAAILSWCFRSQHSASTGFSTMCCLCPCRRAHA